MSDNAIAGLSSHQFKHLSNLRVLDLSHSDGLNSVQLRSALHGLRNFEELNLSSSGIEDPDLQGDLFEELRNSDLKRLNLSHNLLTQVPKLPDFAMLKQLDLSSNRINSISKGGSNFPFTEHFLNRLRTDLTQLYLHQNEFDCEKPCDVELLQCVSTVFSRIAHSLSEDNELSTGGSASSLIFRLISSSG